MDREETPPSLNQARSSHLLIKNNITFYTLSTRCVPDIAKVYLLSVMMRSFTDRMDFNLRTIVIQSSEEVQHFQGTHKCFWCRGIHEIEVNKIINAKLFQLQNDASQVRSEDFRIGVVLHFTLVCFFRVQTESFAGTSSSSTASTLLEIMKKEQKYKVT